MPDHHTLPLQADDFESVAVTGDEEQAIVSVARIEPDGTITTAPLPTVRHVCRWPDGRYGIVEVDGIQVTRLGNLVTLGQVGDLATDVLAASSQDQRVPTALLHLCIGFLAALAISAQRPSMTDMPVRVAA